MPVSYLRGPVECGGEGWLSFVLDTGDEGGGGLLSGDGSLFLLFDGGFDEVGGLERLALR